MVNNSSEASTSLSRRAEEYLQSTASLSTSKVMDVDGLLLLQDLLTYQSDLEKKNAELLQSETEFLQERQYYKDIFSNQPAGLYRIQVLSIDRWKDKSWASSENPPYTMEYASDRFCEILGISPQDFKNNPYIISNLVHPDDKKSFVERNEEANKKFIPFHWEGRLKIREKIVWVRLESLPRLLENKDILWTGILYDLTEEKMTEDQLNQTRLQLEDVLTGANVGSLEWNIQTGKIKYNAIWAKNLGYTSIEIKLGQLLFREKGWKVLTHPDDVPYAEKMLQRHFSGELPYHSVEVRMRHKKGHWVWIRQEGKVKTWMPDGKPLLMYGTHTNISEQKQLEIELRRNEEKYRILFANNPQPMLICNPETLEILEVNEAFIAHYGYSRVEILTMTISDIRPPEDIPEMMEAVSQSKNGSKNLGVKRHKKKNGEIIYVEIRTHIINYHDISAIHVLINDITEQKTAEDALVSLNEKLEERILDRTSELTELNALLKETEVKFKTVSDFTYDWEYWRSPDNKILYMSPSVERITGYMVSEFEECPDLLDKIIHPSDFYLWEDHKKERCISDPNEKKLELSFRIITKNGDICWIGHVCRCIIINGKHLGVRVSNRDITEKVNAENKLINITVDVEERERNRFSRELHDGMGPLLSTVKLYFDWLADTDDAEKKKLIIEKGNISIETAIQTARELAQGMSSQVLSNAGYVDAIKDFIQRINDTNKIKIAFLSNSNDRFGVFFELMLYRITTELIKNTLTYAQASIIEIQFNYKKNFISFTYTDNGIGFDWEKIQKEKKGLGWINIEQRVQILKGKLKVESTFGQGMKVVIKFLAEKNTNTY